MFRPLPQQFGLLPLQPFLRLRVRIGTGRRVRGPLIPFRLPRALTFRQSPHDFDAVIVDRHEVFKIVEALCPPKTRYATKRVERKTGRND